MFGQDNEWLRKQRIPQQLRNQATDAERLLWRHLRGQQLGVKFRRQHPFNNYVLDFVCPDRKLVVEIDGGQHAEAIAKDEARTRALFDAGFRLLRFWNNQVFQETEVVMETILAALAETHPLPSPPLEGEGVSPAARQLPCQSNPNPSLVRVDAVAARHHNLPPLQGEGRGGDGLLENQKVTP